ncbi:DctP family TRAP transporter solute-binding subunit [Nocardiopsis nanhaiensis]
MKVSLRVPGLVMAGCLTLTACGVNATADDGGARYVWDMTVTVGTTSTWFEGAEHFAELVEERSDGRMSIRIFPNEQLSAGDPAAGVEQLMRGDKDFSYNSTIIYAGIDPRFGAINAPFLYTDYTEADEAIESGALDAYTELAAERGVEMLGFGESGFRQVTNNTRPIRAPEDLEGIKVRIPGIGLFTDMYQELGANPATMNFAEVFTSLQQGTIDGQENPMDVISSAGLEEVQDHLTVWNYVYDPLVLGMNQDLFESLPPEDQEIVRGAAAEANELQVASNRDLEESQLAEQAELMEVITLDDEQIAAFQDTLRPLHEEYESVWGEQLTDAVRPQE